MFIFDEAPRFTHTATATVPTDGGHDTQTFTATFRVIGDSQLAKFDMNDRESTSDFLRETLLDFGDIETRDKKQVLFSERTRDWLIDLPYARTALVKCYFAGVYKAATGN